MKKSLKHNVIWMFIGNAIYAFSQWFQISTISKLSDNNSLGNFTLALAIVSPVFMFSNLQLRGVQVTDTLEEWKFSDYFSLRFFSNLVSILFLIIVCLIVDVNIWLILLLSLLKSIEGFSEIFNSRQQLNEQMRLVSISFILKGVSIIISTFIGLYFFKSIEIGLALAITINLLILCLNDYKNCKPLLSNQQIFKRDNIRLKSLLIKAFPLGIVMLILSLNTNSLKYYVEYFLGTETQGVYSSLTYVIILGNFVLSAIAQTILPRLGKFYNEDQLTSFKSIAFKFILISIGIGTVSFIMSYIFADTILALLFNKKFLDYNILFKLIMFSTIFIYCASSLGYILTSMREYKVQPFINMTVLVSNLIFGYIFIRKYGINGLVFSSILSFTIQIIYTSLIILKKYNEKISRTSTGEIG